MAGQGSPDRRKEKLASPQSSTVTPLASFSPSPSSRWTRTRTPSSWGSVASRIPSAPAPAATPPSFALSVVVVVPSAVEKKVARRRRKEKDPPLALAAEKEEEEDLWPAAERASPTASERGLKSQRIKSFPPFRAFPREERTRAESKG